MPWCDDCARFWNPPSLQDGACPTCGARLSAPVPERRVPWHFKLLLVSLVIYLGYRGYQGIAWLWVHVF